MAKSQLKQLKASLKAHGLIGQQPSSKKGKGKDGKSVKKDRLDVLQSIRQQFNPFDTTTLAKRKHQVIGEHQAVVKPGITKQVGEEQRRRAYEVELRHKNKSGGLVDRRFGERNKNLSHEEKMLARFTREKLAANGTVSKKNIFNLDDEDEEDTLTHYGQSLADSGAQDDFNGAMGGSDFSDEEQDSEMEEIMRKRKAMTVGRRDQEEGDEEPTVKRSKKEIMNEIIAKSKKYKAERQIVKSQDEEIMAELDDDMDELLSELHQQAVEDKKNGRNLNTSSTSDDYEKIVKELNFERRAQPADRTKTQEELEKIAKERLAKLQKERQERMEGGDDFGEEEDVDIHGDNLGDNTEFGLPDFEMESDLESEGSASEGESDVEADTQVKNSLPSLAELLKLDDTDKDPSKVVSEALKANAPGRAAGNKQRIIAFTSVLARYLIESDKLQEEYRAKLIDQLRKLAPDAVQPLSEYFRQYIHDNLENTNASIPSHLRAYTLIGILFSTSDHFHLVATAATLAACETLARNPMSDPVQLACGLYLCDLLCKYQRHSKRYIPEIVTFACRLLYAYSPESVESNNINIFQGRDESGRYSLPDKSKPKKSLSFADLDGSKKKQSKTLEQRVFYHCLDVIGRFCALWDEVSAWCEMVDPVVMCLNATANKDAQELASKLTKKQGFAIKERRPLALQSHRPIPLQTIAPKFESNFNPEKKSYDPDEERQSISKLKAEVKKERKGALRDIRRDNQFLAREKIAARRKQDAEYHQKLARLERSVATEEGTEKNKYEREKKARKRASRK